MKFDFLKFLREKTPQHVPTLAEATEALAQARQLHAGHAEELAQAGEEFGRAMLDGTGAEQVKARKALDAAETKERDSGFALALAERRHEVAQEAVQAQAAKEKAAAIDAKLDERHALAVEFDVALDALAAIAQKMQDVHGELRPLNPPAHVVNPDGPDPERVMQLVAFRLRHRRGDVYSPFSSLQETRLGYYLPGAARPQTVEALAAEAINE